MHFTEVFMKKELRYKNLELIYDEDLRSAEFLIVDADLVTLDSYVNFISLVAEYAVLKNPDYIIFNKLNSDYELAKSTIAFTKDIIFAQLKSYGIRKILMVVKEDQFETMYKQIESKNSFMKGFLTLEDAYDWIKAEREKLSL